MLAPMTKRQRSIFEFVVAQITAVGYAPSIMEIRAAFGLASGATVHKHLAALVAKGYITKRFNSHRSIEVVFDPSQTCPLCHRPLRQGS